MLQVVGKISESIKLRAILLNFALKSSKVET